MVLNEDIGCSGCTAKRQSLRTKSESNKIIYISKILVTTDSQSGVPGVKGKTEDLKYAYNDIYSQFIKYAISLKMTY